MARMSTTAVMIATIDPRKLSSQMLPVPRKLAITPPTTEPTTPMSNVARMLKCCRPGSSSRAIAPTTRPKTMKPIMRLAFVVDSVVIPAAAGPNHDVTVDGLPQASNGDAVRYEPYDSDRSPRVRLASARTGQEVSMDLARRFLAAV